MSVRYCLINISKKEKISYYRLPAETDKELTGNPVTSAITTWYLIKNSGDNIGFVPDQFYEEDWPYEGISHEYIASYKDLTDEIINQLVSMNILKDNGIEIFDEDEPDVYVRRLQNIWME